jgi:hypothetical protein
VETIAEETDRSAGSGTGDLALCGMNTSPGMSSRADIEKALNTVGRIDQEITSQSEVYRVYDHV